MKAFLLSLCFFAALPAQQRTVTLHGSRNPRIAKMTDEGPVDDTKRIAGLSIRFKPSSAQVAALERLLEDQQNASSSVYHTWLTPEEFGERFGISENELVKVKDWLAAQGFQIDVVARSRTYVSFSGTAAKVRQAFRTELHRFRSGVGMHFANVSDAEIPAELEPLVSSIGGLHDFRTKAHSRPMYNLDKGGHYLAPGDLNTLYNIHTLHQKGFTGAGQKIVIVGQSRYQKSDLDLFRSKFGLPPTTPKVVAVPGYPDPGVTDTDEFVEAELDIEVAGIAAPDATLVFVYSDDVWTATQYAIDQNLGPVISSSYSLCENWALPTDVTAFRSMAQQASAQGITWLGISGDAGAAGCDAHDADPAAYYGANVTLPASLPEVTGIGGTEFVESTGTYWRNSNNADGSSAMSYIPETAWNDSSTLVKGLAASGGGPSILWDRPTWQSGPGLPHDNVRHVPDISFTASWRHDAYAVIYKGGLLNAGGTSAGAPFFAGALALLNQYVVKAGFQSKPGLGNINPRLYQLAQTTTSVFHDIVTGNNIVPCDLDGWYCDTGSYGYQAGVGYDDVTGLGSIDIGRLVENWGSPVSGQQTSSARMLLTSAPGTVIGSAKADASCDANHPYSQILILQETGGVEVRLNKFTAGGNDASDQIVRWFGSLRLPPYGTMFSHICWTLDSVPTTLDYEVAGVDSSGRTVSAVLRVAFKAAAANPGTLSVSKNAVDLSAGAASINIDAPAGEQWTVTAFIENRKSGWLAASPQSGKGPGQVNLTASGADLAPGVYSATLVFQSPNTAPQYIIVPVSVTISGASDMSISSAGNAASFQKVFAPGMLMSLFGTHLSGATKAAESVPLPQSLEGVTVTVNGIAAPLWYVSPGQINLQLPFETAIGKALVAVNNNGRVTSTLIKIDSTAPGIFTNNGAITPASTAKRGGSVVLYLTGDGETNPMLDTGAPPAANTPLGQLPKPRAPLTVTVGGVKADVAFAGNPWLVGVTQVNFTVPANAPVGAQPVVVTVGGIASALATLNVQ